MGQTAEALVMKVKSYFERRVNLNPKPGAQNIHILAPYVCMHVLQIYYVIISQREYVCMYTHTHTCDRPRHLELSICLYWLIRGILLLYIVPGALKLQLEEEEEEEEVHRW